jgi:hypothetical protein
MKRRYGRGSCRCVQTPRAPDYGPVLGVRLTVAPPDRENDPVLGVRLTVAPPDRENDPVLGVRLTVSCHDAARRAASRLRSGSYFSLNARMRSSYCDVSRE